MKQTDTQKLKKILWNLKNDFWKLQAKYVEKLLPILEHTEAWTYSLSNEIDDIESMVFFYARIVDWLDWKINIDSKWSMCKKMRKVLWYTFA